MEWQEIIRPAEDYKKWQIIGVFYILIPVYSVIKIRLLLARIKAVNAYNNKWA
jgi:hypothetical protein